MSGNDQVIWVKTVDGMTTVQVSLSQAWEVKSPKLTLKADSDMPQNLPMDLLLEVLSWLTPSNVYTFKVLLLNKSVFNMLMINEREQGNRSTYWYEQINKSVAIDPVCTMLLPVLQSYLNNELLRYIVKQRSAPLLTSRKQVIDAQNVKLVFVEAKQTYSMINTVWKMLYAFVSPDVQRNLKQPAQLEDFEKLTNCLHEWPDLMDPHSSNRSYIEKYGRNVLSLPIDLCYSLRVYNGEDPTHTTSDHGMGWVLGYYRMLSLGEILKEFKTMKKLNTQSFVSMDGLCLVPISSVSGSCRLFVNVLRNIGPDRGHRFGEIYLLSGWNVFKKADSWLAYLYNLMDMPLQGIHFPASL